MDSRKVIVLDCDGVLIPGNDYFSESIIGRYNVSPENFGTFFVNQYLGCTRGTSHIEAVLRPFLEENGIPLTVEEFISEWCDYESGIDNDLLKYIRDHRSEDVRWCLASNQEKKRASFLRKNLGLDGVFDECFFSCDIGSVKPEREFFAFIQNLLRTPSTNILYFDDSLRNVEAAQALGWNAVVFTDRPACIDKVNRWMNS